MPTISAEQRKEARRQLALGRRKGDHLVCDGGAAVMLVDGRPFVSPLSEAEALAAKKREDDRWWRLSLGPW